MEAPAPTTVLPPPAEPTRSSVVALAFLAVAAAAFLIGIAVASTVRTAPTGIVVASQRVGPGGANVRFEGGEIRLPPGALGAPTRIVVRRTVVTDRVRVRPPNGPLRVYNPRELVAYIFEPRDIEFLRPVTVIFRLSGEPGGAASFARVGTATLLLGGTFDAERGTLTVETSDFRFTRGQPVGAE
jgi:hypothetical protein